MGPMIVLGAFAAVIVFAIIWFRTNAAVVFLSLCAGSVLASRIQSDAVDFASALFKNENAISQIVPIVLLVTPAILSLIFLRKSVSRSKLAMNVVPAVATAGLAILAVVPLLSNSLQSQLTKNVAYETLDKLGNLIIIIGIISSMATLWLNNHKGHHRKH